MRNHWTLDPDVTFLNHGSFGACPRAVLKRQCELRAKLEAQPVRFVEDELEPMLDYVRNALARFLGADPTELAFVANATTGVNTVLRSLPFARRDELLTTDHAYNACRNALEFVAERTGARVVVAQLPFPLQSADETITAILDRITPRTRLAMIDHITSPTALVLPIREIVAALAERGIDTLVDGAHGPGMVELDLHEIGAAYYTGNCHKWLCAPKGAGFLYVAPDRQEDIRPLAISHGANTERAGRSRFWREFDWVGTIDPTPYLCVATAIETIGGLLPGGWPDVRTHNHKLALAARRELCAALSIPPPCPDSMIGAMAALPLPDLAEPPESLRQRLGEEDEIEVPIFAGPAPGQTLLRISAQLYNQPLDYGQLARALVRTPRAQ